MENIYSISVLQTRSTVLLPSQARARQPKEVWPSEPGSGALCPVFTGSAVTWRPLLPHSLLLLEVTRDLSGYALSPLH